jgi:hypothetical protein
MNTLLRSIFDRSQSANEFDLQDLRTQALHLSQSGQLIPRHQVVVQTLVPEGGDLRNRFQIAQELMNKVENMHAHIQQMDPAMKLLLSLKFSHDEEQWISRILFEASQGDLEAMVFFSMFSKTEEELHELMSRKIEVRIVPNPED